ATMVSKQSNLKIPFVNSWMKTMEAITFDRSNMRDAVRMIRDVVAKLKEGKNVVIFPEGTRSKKMEMGDFKPGSFKPALTAKCTVVPITLVNTFATDVKGKTDNRVKIIFSDPIRYDEFKDMTTTELCEKVKGIIQENLDRGL
ncbi:MAG: 1-acyl-sn-glycerol-3-phosphate acyltransferase, partial [Erysipelotrichaceae bacterium]|nr:1-acyl-sn-glycerol-3-phosphate acyltransferase [Erysipelotrichaceae bacterium]